MPDQYRTAEFGSSRGGLTTVGYTLSGGSRITAGVAEVGTNTGIYGALVEVPDGFQGSILWDTGEGESTVYAGGAVNPDAGVLEAPVGGGTFLQAIRAIAAFAAGDMIESLSPDRTTGATTFKDFMDATTTRIAATVTRTQRTVEVTE
jgi:hypothetical protein